MSAAGARRRAALLRFVRLFVLGCWLHVKVLSRSGVWLVFSMVSPIVMANIAFFMFRTGTRPASPLYAAIGAGMMSVWTTTLIGSGQAITRQRQEGTLELLVAAPTPFALVLAPITVATSVVGLYALGATVVWSGVLFGVQVRVAHPALVGPAVAVTALSLGLLGMVIASVFVFHRHANALTNLFSSPVWLASGLLVPVDLLPDWVRPLSWMLAPTWGVQAVREAVLGGAPLPAIVGCGVLSVAYLGIGVVTVRHFEFLARKRARLALV